MHHLPHQHQPRPSAASSRLIKHAWPLILISLAVSSALVCAPTSANQQLAADMACYNCHASPTSSHQNAPSMARLAEHAAKNRGDEVALKKRAEKLRTSTLLHPIAVHERLSPEMALTLIRWLSEAGPH